MSGDGTQFEYPDQAGYPDGMGTLHEGTDEAHGGDRAPRPTRRVDFAMEDEEDDDEERLTSAGAEAHRAGPACRRAAARRVIRPPARTPGAAGQVAVTAGSTSWMTASSPRTSSTVASNRSPTRSESTAGLDARDGGGLEPARPLRRRPHRATGGRAASPAPTRAPRGPSRAPRTRRAPSGRRGAAAAR